MKILFLIGLIVALYSCQCDCNCRKSILYKKGEVRLLSNDSFIDSFSYRKYLVYNDRTNYDSIFIAFNKKYYSNLNIYKFKFINMVFKLDSALGLKCGETDRFIRDSFNCECAK